MKVEIILDGVRYGLVKSNAFLICDKCELREYCINGEGRLLCDTFGVAKNMYFKKIKSTQEPTIATEDEVLDILNRRIAEEGLRLAYVTDDGEKIYCKGKKPKAETIVDFYECKGCRRPIMLSKGLQRDKCPICGGKLTLTTLEKAMCKDEDN